MSETTLKKTDASQNWPSLRVDEWTASRDTLHMWTQIVHQWLTIGACTRRILPTNPPQSPW